VTKVILEIDDIAKILPKIFIITSITGILSNDMDMSPKVTQGSGVTNSPIRS